MIFDISLSPIQAIRTRILIKFTFIDKTNYPVMYELKKITRFLFANPRRQFQSLTNFLNRRSVFKS